MAITSTEPSAVFAGMQIRLTENRDKKRHFVNGQTATINQLRGKTILASVNDKITLRICPIKPPNGPCYYPFVRAYATTIHKSQGQNLKHITVWFDSPRLPGGCAYVAISRVKTRDSTLFLTKPTCQQFQPK